MNTKFELKNNRFLKEKEFDFLAFVLLTPGTHGFPQKNLASYR